jgi:hypothetical protein
MSTYAQKSQNSSQDQQLLDHVSRQSRRLIFLLESINCPQDLYSMEELESALFRHYQQESRGKTRPNGQVLLPPTSHFLDWLVQNVSAETNWPDHNSHVALWDFREEQQESGGVELENENEDEESAFNAEMKFLDQEHLQLQ